MDGRHPISRPTLVATTPCYVLLFWCPVQSAVGANLIHGKKVDNAAVCFKANQWVGPYWAVKRRQFLPANERTHCAALSPLPVVAADPLTSTPSLQSVFANKDGYHQRTRVSGSVCQNYSEMHIFSSWRVLHKFTAYWCRPPFPPVWSKRLWQLNLSDYSTAWRVI